MPAGVQRSEAEWSCLNNGDGCNRILSLNDGQRGEHVITSSQPVHQPERVEEKQVNFNCSVLLFHRALAVTLVVMLVRHHGKHMRPYHMVTESQAIKCYIHVK